MDNLTPQIYQGEPEVLGIMGDLQPLSSSPVLLVCLLSHSSHVLLGVSPWTVARQAPLSKGFSRQEYWSRLPCPLPGDLPDPGIESVSLYVSCIGRWVLYLQCHLESPLPLPPKCNFVFFSPSIGIKCHSSLRLIRARNEFVSD